jgi:hypothetical protein
VQIKGEYKIEEFSSGNDEDDFIFTATVEGSGPEQDACKKMADSLQEPVLLQLRQFIADINKIE